MRRRQEIEAAQAQVEERKKLHRKVSEHFECRAQLYKDRAAYLAKHIELWGQVLQYITALPTHGSKKAEDMTWHAYFEQGLGEPLSDVPPQFTRADLPFCDCVLAVTKHLGMFQEEHGKAENYGTKAAERSHKRRMQNERREERAQKQVAKATSSSGPDQVEEKQNLGAIVFFHGSMGCQLLG